MKARFAVLATLVLASCGDYYAPDSVVFGTVVATQHAGTVNWSGYDTFSVNPIVSVIDGTGSVIQNCSVDGSQLVPTITTAMQARGYTPVAWTTPTDPGAAHLQLQMTAMLGTQDIYYSSWCSWYGYYYCYPGWTYAGSYSFGTLVVDMGDRKNAGSPGGKIPLVWTNANYGVLASYYAKGCTGGGTNVNWARIQAAIQQGFNQSPYIQRTP